MAECRVKIKASINEINKHFTDCPSRYFYIRHFNGEKTYKGDNDKPIIFEVLIRHNEIGKRSMERKAPYTLATFETILSRKVNEFKQEQIKDIEHEYLEKNNLDENSNVSRIINNCAFILDGIDERNKTNEQKEDYPEWATKENIELIERWSELQKGKINLKEQMTNIHKASEIDEVYDIDY